MKFSLTAAVAALASTSTASINYIAVPNTIAIGQTIPVKLTNNIDQSTTYQTSIAFGLGARPVDSNNVIGTPVASIYLQDGSMPAAPFTRNITIADWRWGTRKGKFEIRAVVSGVYGVSGEVGTTVYRANVSVADTVGDEFVQLEWYQQ